MFVCHCRAVSDSAIRSAIRSGAHTVEDLMRRCGAGTDCGSCQPALRDLLAQEGFEAAVRGAPYAAHPEVA